ncbi:MAG: hypothetical protein PUK05_06795 [Peptoniphilaceae bacterium]|nr:hypothetical protein [Peptoniphilaceae bacterium]MDY5765768.1 hypothetical protein [Peptoniphilaceae bacterium]
MMRQVKLEARRIGLPLGQTLMGIKYILQVNPSIDKSAHLSKYIVKAKSSEEKSHKAFLRDFGGKVFAVMPVSGTVPADVELRMIAERELL